MSTSSNDGGWDLDQSPFHDGERAIQERVGVREKVEEMGQRVVRRHLTQQHREYFPMLPYIFVGSVDAQGQPWASVLFGEPGFVAPTSDTSVTVTARAIHGDPLTGNLHPGADIALLGVQLHTRRRNRITGMVEDVGDSGFTLSVRQTLGICPQYIQGREPQFTRDPLATAPRAVRRSDSLDEEAQALIEHADTYFVASANPNRADGVASGADVSHRGGRPGFVRVDDERTPTAPEFVGNFIFNTLGNWQVDDRAGLLFIDFERGRLLFVAARAEVIWEGSELRAFAGAQRLVRYHVTQTICIEDALPARFSPPQYSPLLGRTGTWAEAAEALDAERRHNEWRPFRIESIDTESDGVRSFRLEPADGRGRASFIAGQYIPVRVHPSGWEQPAIRSYSLSAAPDSSGYRISVKRAGRAGVSDWLHETARVGDLIELLAPRGDFTFDTPPRRPAVLISAGIGITPFMAMLDSLLVNDGRTRHHAPIWFIHGARNSTTHPFAAHLRDKLRRHDNLTTHIRYSQPLATDRVGISHDSEGHVDIALLKAILPFDDYDFYLCGPQAWMQDLYDGLVGLSVSDERIRFEGFGAAPIVRANKTAPPDEVDEDAVDGVEVEFARSGRSAMLRPGSGSLLDLAERTGVAALSSCRSGVCGTCAVKIQAGQVAYLEQPDYPVCTGEALLCVAIPERDAHRAQTSKRGRLTLEI